MGLKSLLLLHPGFLEPVRLLLPFALHCNPLLHMNFTVLLAPALAAPALAGPAMAAPALAAQGEG
jgi:hypothetical protein